MAGKTELVYLTEKQFQIAEDVRKRLGFSRSGFYRHCIMHVLQELSALTENVHKEAVAHE